MQDKHMNQRDPSPTSRRSGKHKYLKRLFGWDIADSSSERRRFGRMLFRRNIAAESSDELHRFIRVFFGRPVVIFSLGVLFVLIFSAIFAAWLAPYNPYKPDIIATLQQPSWEHLLGTDSLGRDTLSRIIYGARTSLMVGFVAVGIAASVGITLGLFAGYLGGIVNIVLMRFIDVLMPFPRLLLALIIASLLGGGLVNVMIAIGIGSMPGYARLMCALALSIKENDYILAAQTMGSSKLRIMIFHVLPNAFPAIIVLITMMMGRVILSEAGLSFLGVGIESPGAAWGAMVSDGYRYLLTNPVLSFAPGLAIITVALAFNMVGDGLRDALDPKLRGKI